MGLTENPRGFQTWMMTGREQARLLKEFEAGVAEESEDDLHHEERLTFQENFKKHTAVLISCIKSLGRINPFLEAGSQSHTASGFQFDQCKGKGNGMHITVAVT